MSLHAVLAGTVELPDPQVLGILEDSNSICQRDLLRASARCCWSETSASLFVAAQKYHWSQAHIWVLGNKPIRQYLADQARRICASCHVMFFLVGRAVNTLSAPRRRSISGFSALRMYDVGWHCRSDIILGILESQVQAVHLVAL